MSEHRVFPDKNVEQETWQFARSVTPLETCNALSDKIEKAIATLKDELAQVSI